MPSPSAQLIQASSDLSPSPAPHASRSRRAGLPQRACIAVRGRQGPSCTAPRPRIAAATFPSIPSAAHMREASPHSPQQEQRYLRDVFRERGDLLGDGWAAAPLPAPRAVPPSPSPPDSPARVPPPLEGTERDTRQPEDTTAPRKATASSSPLPRARSMPASSKRLEEFDAATAHWKSAFGGCSQMLETLARATDDDGRATARLWWTICMASKVDQCKGPYGEWKGEANAAREDTYTVLSLMLTYLHIPTPACATPGAGAVGGGEGTAIRGAGGAGWSGVGE